MGHVANLRSAVFRCLIVIALFFSSTFASFSQEKEKFIGYINACTNLGYKGKLDSLMEILSDPNSFREFPEEDAAFIKAYFKVKNSRRYHNWPRAYKDLVSLQKQVYKGNYKLEKQILFLIEELYLFKLINKEGIVGDIPVLSSGLPSNELIDKIISSRKVSNSTKVLLLKVWGWYQFRTGNIDMADACFTKALEVCREFEDVAYYLEKNVLSANVNFHIENLEFDTAFGHCKNLMSIFDNEESTDARVFDVYISMGFLYSIDSLEQYNIDSTLYYYNKAEKYDGYASVYSRYHLASNLLSFWERAQDSSKIMKYKIMALEYENQLDLDRGNFERKRLRAELKEQKLMRENELSNELAESRKQMNYVLILLCGVLCLSVVLILWFIRKLRYSYNSLIARYKRQSKENIQLIISLEEKYNSSNVDLNTKEIKSNNNDTELDQNFKERLMVRINRLMIDEKLFANENFRIQDICDLIEVNRSYVSKTINDLQGCNFSQFVNNYRIREACTIIDSKGELYTIEAISKMVGFKSKSSFYNSFKETIGVTPAFYMRQS